MVINGRASALELLHDWGLGSEKPSGFLPWKIKDLFRAQCGIYALLGADRSIGTESGDNAIECIMVAVDAANATGTKLDSPCVRRSLLPPHVLALLDINDAIQPPDHVPASVK